MPSELNIQGFWFEAGSSTRRTGILQVNGETYELHIEDAILRQGPLSQIDVSDRVGHTPRRLSWADGAVLETRDNPGVDTLFGSGVAHSSGATLLHGLESRWRWVLLALVLTIVTTVVFFRYGLPAAADHVAHALPVSVTQSMSEGALATLDKTFFDATGLRESQQAQVQAVFDALTSRLPEHPYTFKLHFRQLDGMPNAMALPGGDIILTDAFVRLLDTDEELQAVLLHEFGHVIDRHGLQQVIQASTVSVLVALMIGNPGVLGDIALAVPTFILQSGYSRRSETEADEFALAQMMALQIDPVHFATIMEKLGGLTDGVHEDDAETAHNYLSTHPSTQARIERARALSREFSQAR